MFLLSKNISNFILNLSLCNLNLSLYKLQLGSE